jgi:HEAT repeat protein
MKRFLVGCVFLLLLPWPKGWGAAPPAAPSSDEPTYNGQRLSQWVKCALDDDAISRSYARLALTTLSGWEVAGKALPPLIEALKDKDRRKRDYAAQALYIFGIGPKAEAEVASLIKALADKDPWVRYRATRDLQHYYPAAKAAIPALTKALKDSDRDVRQRAAITLGRFGPDGKVAVPALIQVLKDKSRASLHSDYVEAAAALGAIGPAAKAAVPVLARTLKDEYRTVRLVAAHALGQIGPEAKAALPDLRKALRDEEEIVHPLAAWAIWRVGGSVKEALPAMVKVLEVWHKDRPGPLYNWGARLVIRGLAEMGPPAKEAVPILLPLSKDKDEGIRWWARQALKKIAPPVAKKKVCLRCNAMGSAQPDPRHEPDGAPPDARSGGPTTGTSLRTAP